MEKITYLKNLYTDQLTKQNYSTIELIQKLYNQKTKGSTTGYIAYNGFGSNQKPEYPEDSNLKSASHDNPLLDHIKLVFQTHNDEDAKNFKISLKRTLDERNHKNYALLLDTEKSNSRSTYWVLYIEVDYLMLKPQFLALSQKLLDSNFTGMLNSFQDKVSVLPIDTKLFNYKLNLETLTNNQYKNENIVSETYQKLNIDTRFFKENNIADSDLTKTDEPQTFDMSGSKFSKGLPLDAKPTNISEYFIELMKANDQYVGPNAKMKLDEAGFLIERAFNISLLDNAGSDKDSVVIYDPISGIWTHNEDLIYSLLCTLRPYSKKNDIDTVLRTFGANARNDNRFFKPYDGSRYLLFLNGVLDVKTMVFYGLSEPFIKDLHFQERSQLNINYLEHPELPEIENELTADNGESPWNPRDFLWAYADNDPEIVQYLLFCLSLGLFGGHNFGVHVDIQGESRWGKTTLLEIFNGLFNNRTQSIPYSALNGRFPFTSYNPNTSTIWISECNIGIEPLNDEHGVVTYDGLADNQVHFEVKGTDDLILHNPPQVFIDGTQFINAKEINTGPAGRTLAIKLPERTDELRDQAYALNIKDDLHQKNILQWIVWELIQAFRKTVPVNRIENLKLNLSLKQDLALIPNRAKQWRTEFSNSSSGLKDWFENQMLRYWDPSLKNISDADPENETTVLMHDQVMYEFYKDFYLNEINANDIAMRDMPFSKFKQEIHQLYEQSGLIIKEAGSTNKKPSENVRTRQGNDVKFQARKQVGKLDALNFDVRREGDYQLPRAYDKTPAQLPRPFRNRRPGWYYVYVAPEN